MNYGSGGIIGTKHEQRHGMASQHKLTDGIFAILTITYQNGCVLDGHGKCFYWLIFNGIVTQVTTANHHSTFWV
jgi:hypothetical protein